MDKIVAKEFRTRKATFDPYTYGPLANFLSVRNPIDLLGELIEVEIPTPPEALKTLTVKGKGKRLSRDPQEAPRKMPRLEVTAHNLNNGIPNESKIFCYQSSLFQLLFRLPEFNDWLNFGESTHPLKKIIDNILTNHLDFEVTQSQVALAELVKLDPKQQQDGLEFLGKFFEAIQQSGSIQFVFQAAKQKQKQNTKK